MSKVTDMNDHKDQGKVKIPDLSEEMDMLKSKVKFLEAASLALANDRTNDPDYYMPGLSNILEEIGSDVHKMYQTFYGQGGEHG